MSAADWLADSLALTVPLTMHRFRGWPEDTLRVMVEEAAPALATTGDTLQYSKPDVPFKALATGLAAGAILSPTGINYMGMHWCARRHRGCPHATTAKKRTRK